VRRRVPARVAWMEVGGERVVPWPLGWGEGSVCGGAEGEGGGGMGRGVPHPLGVVGDELARRDDGGGRGGEFRAFGRVGGFEHGGVAFGVEGVIIVGGGGGGGVVGWTGGRGGADCECHCGGLMGCFGCGPRGDFDGEFMGKTEEVWAALEVV